MYTMWRNDISVHYPLKSPNRGYMNIPQSAYAQYVLKILLINQKIKHY